MNLRALSIVLLIGGLLVSGCATYPRRSLDPAQAAQIEAASVRRSFAPSRETQEAILALDPHHVSENDIRGVLSQVPAPRIINIHGGIYPVHRQMIGFCEFLIGMGYPAASLTNPGDGTYTFSCYESSEKIAGVIAWYYEREGMRPMIVGHSQGGFQAIKVLRKLAGITATRLHLWNPLTWKPEESCDFIDPLTGERRSVVGLRLPYATVVGAGGLTRLLPNQWDMCMSLHDIPDSAEEFTGFCKHMDLLGGDFLGYGAANEYEPIGTAEVRNVWLPTAYRHRAIPNTRHLLKSQEIVDWINNYQPAAKLVDKPELNVKFDSNSANILWAAEVWHSIKKHWVLELQRRIRPRPMLEGSP